jgi:hypothetical protein
MQVIEPDGNFNNCIAIKVDIFTTILKSNYHYAMNSVWLSDSHGKMFKAFFPGIVLADSNTYFYLFNVPPGDYSVQYGEINGTNYEERKINTFGPNHQMTPMYVSTPVSSYINTIHFDSAFLSKAKVTIDRNEFKFIGSFTVKTESTDITNEGFFGLSSKIKSQITETSLVSYDNDQSSVHSQFDFFLREFKGSAWIPLIKKEYDSIKNLSTNSKN